MSTAVQNGVNHPIALYVSEGIPYPYKGARNLLFASHFLIPSIPVTLTLTDVLPVKLPEGIKTDEIKRLMNEVCNPHFIF
jgi:hypothetical protein